MDEARPLNRKPWPAPYSTADMGQMIGRMVISLPLAMALLDDTGRILVRNDAFRVTVGEDDKVGDRVEHIVLPEAQAEMRRAFARVLATQEPVELRAAVPSRPDEKQSILVQPVPAVLGYAAVVSMRDIREQLRVEAQVAAATRMQAVGQLAGGVAHDFNNILTAVLMLTDQLLSRHPETSPDHAALIEIRRNGLRAAALVEQLLAFARQQPQRQQLLDIAALVVGLRPLVAQLVGPAIMLAIDAKPLASAVLADPTQIEQVIVNLAVNARDAMDGNGHLAILVSDVPANAIAAEGHRIIPHVDHVRIDVVDTGTGIPPEIAGKIFEPFFTTKPMGQGTGLGLSTVYGIVKQSGGYVFAMPLAEGHGTKFSIYLPAMAKPAEVAPVPVARQISDHERLIGMRVLLVEDDNAVRTIFDRALQHRGLLVTACASADPALEWLASDTHFDVLVSDIMMPGIDGVELARRARLLRPGLVTVLVSGYAEMPLHRAADAQGVNFLSKPFSLSELMDAIAEVILENRKN
jgi:signal transduction histidine kinase/ActR/RegA family two-component response regulator